MAKPCQSCATKDAALRGWAEDIVCPKCENGTEWDEEHKERTSCHHCEGSSIDWPRFYAALSDKGEGTVECEKCNGTGARHVAGEPVLSEPCGECSGEGVVSGAGEGWLEVREQARGALVLARRRLHPRSASYIIEEVDKAIAALGALGGK